MQSLITRISLAAMLVLALILIPSGFQLVQPVHATLNPYLYQTASTDSSWFGSNSSMTYSVSNVNTYRYNVDGNNQMHLMLDLVSGTIGGTSTGFLTVKLPEGRTAHATVQIPALAATDNGNSGTWFPVYCIISANDTKIYCRPSSGANFSTNSGTFRLDVNTVLEVNDAP